MNEEQAPSGSRKNEERDDEEKEYSQAEESMEQEPDQAGRVDDKASVGGGSILDYNFLNDDEEGTETLAGTTEPAEDETSTLEPPSAFKSAAHNLQESSSPGENKITIRIFQRSLRAGENRRRSPSTFVNPARRRVGSSPRMIMKTEQAVV